MRTLAIALLALGCSSSTLGRSDQDAGPWETGGADGSAGASPAESGAPGDAESGVPDAPAEAVPAPACAPEDLALGLPVQLVWPTYDASDGTYCARCVQSPCGTCSAFWFPLEWQALRLSSSVMIDCDFPALSGPCGAEQGCSLGLYGRRYFDVDVEPTETGYQIVRVEHAGAVSTSGDNTCGIPVSDPLATTSEAQVEAALAAADWDCPVL